MTINRAVTEMGIFHYLAEDAFIGGVLRRGRAWEHDVLRLVLRYLPPDGPCNVVDVGAHVGTHAIPYARSVQGRGRVYAFEPQSIMASLLAHNVEANGGLAVDVLRFAVGHVDGLEVSMEPVIRDGPNAGQPFDYEDGREYNYGGLQIGRGGQSVMMRTLDSFAFEDIGLLKIDAEGAEPLVLWGARELIRRCRPLVLFERNIKTVTDAMRSMVDIPREVENFRIEDYASTLGYEAPAFVGVDQYLLRRRS